MTLTIDEFAGYDEAGMAIPTKSDDRVKTDTPEPVPTSTPPSTLEAVARLTGLSIGAVYHIRNGTRGPRLSTVMRLSAVLQCRPENVASRLRSLYPRRQGTVNTAAIPTTVQEVKTSGDQAPGPGAVKGEGVQEPRPRPRPRPRQPRPKRVSRARNRGK